MTDQEIIEMAAKAGGEWSRSIWPPTLSRTISFTPDQLEKLVNLAVAHGREQKCKCSCASTFQSLYKDICQLCGKEKP